MQNTPACKENLHVTMQNSFIYLHPFTTHASSSGKNVITSSQQVADYIPVIANSLMRTFLMQGTGNKRSNTWKLN